MQAKYLLLLLAAASLFTTIVVGAYVTVAITGMPAVRVSPRTGPLV